jgi:hypothetical protein
MAYCEREATVNSRKPRGREALQERFGCGKAQPAIATCKFFHKLEITQRHDETAFVRVEERGGREGSAFGVGGIWLASAWRENFPPRGSQDRQSWLVGSLPCLPLFEALSSSNSSNSDTSPHVESSFIAGQECCQVGIARNAGKLSASRSAALSPLQPDVSSSLTFAFFCGLKIFCAILL